MIRSKVRNKEPRPDERSVTVNKVSLVRAVGHDRQSVVQGIDLTDMRSSPACQFSCCSLNPCTRKAPTRAKNPYVSNTRFDDREAIVASKA